MLTESAVRYIPTEVTSFPSIIITDKYFLVKLCFQNVLLFFRHRGWLFKLSLYTNQHSILWKSGKS